MPSLKTFKDPLGRDVWKCHLTGVLTLRAFLFMDLPFANPYVCFYFFKHVFKPKKDQKREDILTGIVKDSGLTEDVYSVGQFEDYSRLLQDRSLEDSFVSWDQESLLSAADFKQNCMEVEDSDEEKPKKEKIKKAREFVYILQEDDILEMEVAQGESANRYLPPELWYYGEEELPYKNQKIPVKIYNADPSLSLLLSEEPAAGENKLFFKYFGSKVKPIFGTVYLQSPVRLPMMESESVEIEKAMEAEEVQDKILEGKQKKARKAPAEKRKRVSKKALSAALEKIADSVPGTEEEKKAVEEVVAVLPAVPEKKKRVRKPKISISPSSSEESLKSTSEEKPKKEKKKREKKEEKEPKVKKPRAKKAKKEDGEEKKE